MNIVHTPDRSEANRSQVDDELVHVFPLFGREHVLDGRACWCHPDRDSTCPELVLHNVAN